MIIKSDYLCTGCSACASICPHQAIKMEQNNEGFFYPSINNSLCTHCFACQKICPLNTTRSSPPPLAKPLAYACQNKDLAVRTRSSSGGTFFSIAKYIISCGGLVFGSCFNEKWEVVHSSVENIADLSPLCGSKYVQSNINDSFLKIRDALKQSRFVLFAGTPCQVEGLLSFLGKPFPNLFTLDFVCHGVPSPLLFRFYVNEMQKKGEIKKIDFRSKRYGYAASTMAIEYQNGKTDFSSHLMKSYKRLYFKGLISRPSCYNCKFKTISRVSDFTLFDCWHINSFDKQLDDDLGTSYLFTHSQKALELFHQIQDEFHFVPVDIKKAIALDGSMMEQSDTPHPNREAFFQSIPYLTYKQLVKKYASPSVKEKINGLLKPILYKTGIIKFIKRKK